MLCIQKLLELPTNDLTFSGATMKMLKIEKFAANLHDKEEYVTLIRNLN